MNPRVFILILNWNGWKDTIECLEYAFRISYPNFRIVVLDNGSTDESLARIVEWAKRENNPPMKPARGSEIDASIPVVSYTKEEAEQGGSPENEQRLMDSSSRFLVLVQTGSNRGFAGGNNVGIRYALAQGADYVLLLNNDAYFRSPESLGLMVDFMESNPVAGACGGRLFYPDGMPQQSYGNFPTVLRIFAYLFPIYKFFPRQWFKGVKRSNVVPGDAVQLPIKIDWPSGACLMVRRKTIEEVGLMDERYFLFVEESDWCFRMRRYNWNRYYIPQVEVVHTFGGSSRNGSEFMKRIHLQSQFTFYGKHFSRGLLAITAAGYLVRSLLSAPAWKIATFLLPEKFRVEARQNADYWLLALDLSTAALRSCISGKRNINQKFV